MLNSQRSPRAGLGKTPAPDNGKSAETRTAQGGRDRGDLSSDSVGLPPPCPRPRAQAKESRAAPSNSVGASEVQRGGWTASAGEALAGSWRPGSLLSRTCLAPRGSGPGGDLPPSSRRRPRARRRGRALRLSLQGHGCRSPPHGPRAPRAGSTAGALQRRGCRRPGPRVGGGGVRRRSDSGETGSPGPALRSPCAFRVCAEGAWGPAAAVRPPATGHQRPLPGDDALSGGRPRRSSAWGGGSSGAAPAPGPVEGAVSVGRWAHPRPAGPDTPANDTPLSSVWGTPPLLRRPAPGLLLSPPPGSGPCTGPTGRHTDRQMGARAAPAATEAGEVLPATSLDEGGRDACRSAGTGPPLSRALTSSRSRSHSSCSRAWSWRRQRRASLAGLALRCSTLVLLWS